MMSDRLCNGGCGFPANDYSRWCCAECANHGHSRGLGSDCTGMPVKKKLTISPIHTCGGMPGCAACYTELHAKVAAAEKRAEEAVQARDETVAAWATAADDRDTYSSQLAAANAEIERLRGTTRIIDGKFEVRGGVIVKTSSGEVVPEDEPLILQRGRDRLMLPTLEHYRRLSELDGCNDVPPERHRRRDFRKFAEYASDPSRMKQPGVTRGAAWSGGHSDDCPSRCGGECTYPCYMQPTTRERS